MTRDELSDILKKNVATITFTKNSGDNRVMRATLMEQYLPVKPIKTIIRPKPDSIMAVYDLDNNGWRSFRIDSVLGVAV